MLLTAFDSVRGELDVEIPVDADVAAVRLAERPAVVVELGQNRLDVALDDRVVGVLYKLFRLFDIALDSPVFVEFPVLFFDLRLRVAKQFSPLLKPFDIRITKACLVSGFLPVFGNFFDFPGRVFNRRLGNAFL